MKLHYSFLIFVFTAFTLKAQIIHIPADQPTIQAGIENALDGDTILVEEGTYFENIDFLGKPITVASHFILDGDTSHISKTIIDGSQPSNPEKASTVSLWSGEDTTSVLMGFTITGGGGTSGSLSADLGYGYHGGGILIVKSGGKIFHNIITKNHILTEANGEGAGIAAIVFDNHSVLIQNNIISNNSIDSYDTGRGAGIHARFGRIILEGNIISQNSLIGGIGLGAGIFWNSHNATPDQGVIEEVFIRNNMFLENDALQCDLGRGGGILTATSSFSAALSIYNNIFKGNAVSDKGGAIYNYDDSLIVSNNTFINNMALEGGNNIAYYEEMVIVNNIFWRDDTIAGSDFAALAPNEAKLWFYNNLLNEPLGPENPFIAADNIYLDPLFMDDSSFELAEISPAIGRGVDSLLIGPNWYKAPAFDIQGNPRPSDGDQFVDIGAYESDFQRPILPNADLVSFGAVGHSLDPEFHKDSLDYLMAKNPGAKPTDNWYIYPADNLATLDIDTAPDLTSEDELDRTTTILVTASDGTTQKEYTVVYKYLSSDTTLASLEVGEGVLDPVFDPMVTEYYDTIPYGIKTVPEVIVSASDPSALVVVKDAQDVYNQFEIIRTTTITVVSPNELFTQEYTVLFTMDMTRPELELLQDSVEAGGEISTLVAESDQVYLVPVNTPGIFDSIIDAQLAEIEAGIADTVYLSTSGVETGTYWLYACDRHQSVSESQEVIIFEKDITLVSNLPEENIKVYPSPVTQTLYIDSPYSLEEIELYNVIGKPVLKVRKPAGSINVSYIPEGLYILRMITEQNQVYTARIIKK